MKRLKLMTLLLCTFAPSPIRLLVWRILGFKVGRHCRVSIFSVVVADRIEIGHGSVIEPFTLIYRPTLLSLGERSRIASFVRIIGWTGQVLIGPQTFIALSCLIDCTGDFELGPRSQIGPQSMLYTHGSTGLIFNVQYPHRNGPIRVGNDCWICMGCIVYPKVSIGDRVIVLPGATVRHDLAPETVILPTSHAHQTIQTRFLQETVTTRMQQDHLREMLRRYAEHGKGGVIVETGGDVLTMELPRQRKIRLLMSGYTPQSGDSDTRATRTVVWTLHRVETPRDVPQFCFSELAVSGPWTPFAEDVVRYLCEKEGVHFVFEANRS